MPKAITAPAIKEMVANGEKFTMLTAYDATFASLISGLGVETLLIGDSLGMVVQGQESTLPVTVEEMAYHVKAVARGNKGALLVADMPFNSYGTVEQCLATAGALMQAGAHMVKLEGGAWLCDSVTAMTRMGIPSCVHMGLTPQSVNKFGGYKVQGREDEAAKAMIQEAVAIAEAGADFILLECVPSDLGKAVTEAVDIPVIGIGAGSDTDGQVLVCYDMLGLTQHRLPKFVKNYMAEHGNYENAIKAYVEEVKAQTFPSKEHGFE